MLVSLRYPLLRAQVPVPSYIHAWVLGHPRLGNALFNLVRPAALLAGLASATAPLTAPASGACWRDVHVAVKRSGKCGKPIT